MALNFVLPILVLALLCPSPIVAAVGIRQFDSGQSGKFTQCKFLDGVFASVMRSIYNPGFHKDLSTDIELMLTTSVLPEKCRLVIEETIPRGMYVDPDQLRDVQEFKGLRTFTAARVDVEKPEFESESFRLYVFKDLRIQENLRLTSVELPVHLRYQKARAQTVYEKKDAEQPTGTVRLQNPRLLLSCEGENVAQMCPDRTVSTFCDSSGTSKCEYLLIPYKVNVNAVEVSVPVGNLEQAPYVVGATTLVISCATIYLFLALFRAPEMVDP